MSIDLAVGRSLSSDDDRPMRPFVCLACPLPYFKQGSCKRTSSNGMTEEGRIPE